MSNETIEQMKFEILFMREWDNYLREQLGEKQYDFLSAGFARTKCYNGLKGIGATDAEAKEACDFAEGKVKKE